MKGKLIIIKYFWFSLVIFHISCNRKIYEKRSFEDSYTLILDKKENSFIEYLQYMNIKDTFYGTWTRERDTIFLNIKKPRVIYLDSTKGSVVEYKCKNPDSLYFKVRFINLKKQDTINYFTIYFNDEKKEGIYAENSIETRKFMLHKFYISALECIADFNYIVKDTTNNCFDVEVICQDSLYPDILRINPVNRYLRRCNKLIPIYEEPQKAYAFKRRFFVKHK